jgi:osmotically-inducible protein OsmY
VLKPEVIKAVRAAFEREPRVKIHSHRLKLAFDADDALIVEGEVPDVAAKKTALRLAAAIPGVVAIVDRIHVLPSRKMGDGEIREHVRDAFLEEPVFDQCGLRILNGERWMEVRAPQSVQGCTLEVAVDDGIVTLNGRVVSLSHKRLAGALAWWVPGTRDVINGIEVTPEEQDSDEEITEAVRLVLEKDPLVDARQVQVMTRDAVVTLEGLVKNEAERNMIEMDTWCVSGVNDVNNRLHCESS